MCNSILDFFFFFKFMRIFIVQVNTFQIAMLLQFNEQLSLTAKEMHENTGIQMDYILQMLTYLVVKVKILKSTDKGNITENSIVELNTEYKGYVISCQQIDITQIQIL